jgi:hypothetical protein
MAIVPGDHNSAREMRTMEITAAFLEQNLAVLFVGLFLHVVVSTPMDPFGPINGCCRFPS